MAVTTNVFLPPQALIAEKREEGCSICWDPMDERREDVVSHLANGVIHAFHKNCLIPFFQERHEYCPLCREEITNVQDMLPPVYGFPLAADLPLEFVRPIFRRPIGSLSHKIINLGTYVGGKIGEKVGSLIRHGAPTGQIVGKVLGSVCSGIMALPIVFAEDTPGKLSKAAIIGSALAGAYLVPSQPQLLTNLVTKIGASVMSSVLATSLVDYIRGE